VSVSPVPVFAPAGVPEANAKDGTPVACENLRVLITKEDGPWIAQGLEIDYAVDGDTISEVKH
jgi:hypothetical protein